jgi:hypothetical protein
MPRVPAVLLSVVLAAVLHLDWHVARPTHHRLSLDWSYHWIVTALLFAAIAWFIARKWPQRAWALGAWVFVAAVIIAQGVEPVLESAFYDGQLAYDVEPERWTTFLRSMAAATPMYWGTLWLATRRTTSIRAS